MFYHQPNFIKQTGCGVTTTSCCFYYRHLGQQPQYLPLKHGFDEWFGAPNCHYEYNNKVMPNIPVYKNEHMIGRYYDDLKFNHTTAVANFTQWYIQVILQYYDSC